MRRADVMMAACRSIDRSDSVLIVIDAQPGFAGSTDATARDAARSRDGRRLAGRCGGRAWRPGHRDRGGSRHQRSDRRRPSLPACRPARRSCPRPSSGSPTSRRSSPRSGRPGGAPRSSSAPRRTSASRSRRSVWRTAASASSSPPTRRSPRGRCTSTVWRICAMSASRSGTPRASTTTGSGPSPRREPSRQTIRTWPHHPASSCRVCPPTSWPGNRPVLPSRFAPASA